MLDFIAEANDTPKKDTELLTIPEDYDCEALKGLESRPIDLQEVVESLMRIVTTIEDIEKDNQITDVPPEEQIQTTNPLWVQFSTTKFEYTSAESSSTDGDSEAQNDSLEQS